MKAEIRRIARKFMMLSALVVCLIALSSGHSEARASMPGMCCSVDCDEMLYHCYEQCGDPAPGACIFFCEWRYNRCVTVPCNPDC